MSLHRPFRLKPALAGFLLVLFVASSQAADYIPAGQPIPENIRWVGDTVAGADTEASAFWRNRNLGTTTSYRFPVPVSSATLGKLATAALKRGTGLVGAGLLLRDLVNGAGWVIDELSSQVLKDPGTPAQPLGPVAWCTLSPSMGVSQKRCVDTKEMTCAASTRINGVGATCLNDASTNRDDVVVWKMDRPSNPGVWYYSLSWGREARPQTDWPSGTNANESTMPVLATDFELGELLKRNPQIVNAILIDPETGAPIRTPELVQALNNLRRALEAANGLEPSPDLESDPSMGEELTPSETQWPGFCSWATKVCDFIDWVKADDTETEKPEVPFEEQPMPTEEWSSGLGNGSCPAPYTASVALAGTSQTVEFSVEPICELGRTMHNLIIAMALLLSPMIIGGFRSSKDA